MEKEIKQKIIKALEPKKKFSVSWGETLWYEKEIEAVDKEEVERMFYDGEIEFLNKDVIGGKSVSDSFEVTEA